MYEKELEALKTRGRLRKRRVFSPDLVDLASNDYLRLAHNKTLFERAADRLRRYGVFAPKASQLINGYHSIHRDFERLVAKLHGYERALVVGSGFLGNIALFEALARKGDLLLIDEEYHASGILAAKLTRGKVAFFAHNDADDLRRKMERSGRSKRVFAAAEGVYSMSGELVAKEVIETAKRLGATLIIDEAHSGGVVGENLLGALDFYGISSENVVRLGALGKAYGSYGAYIAASEDIIAFLANRAKSVVYSTAPSLFDIAYALEAQKWIYSRRRSIANAVQRARRVADKRGYKTDSLILPIAANSDREALSLQRKLIKEGFLVGAIRRPTVKTPRLRVILRENAAVLEKFFACLQKITRRA
ncbi:MAG: pyridoxal phosphate-dependent aminotransferase family protein [Helicobacteraceae bacterium]|jgi:8-amino-7-oxononanoate synthase|nr:pyridoxal phosphate-dependent aminotransferase family protein [Helicobacteraceae bacterium]